MNIAKLKKELPFEYLPKEKRKKIFLICDDVKVTSGVATVAKEIVSRTAQHFNWVQMAGVVNHPDKGKRLDLSGATNEILGIKDAEVIQYPVDGYGNPEIMRQIIDYEKPDAIMLFTDPRYFDWIFQMENEIRKNIPIIYLNIWDDLPYPLYNSAFYESCDLLMGISKQTFNINKVVLEGKEKNKLFKYLPHGLDSDIYKPIDQNNPNLLSFKEQLFKGRKDDFVIFFNSRNQRRKQIPDTILAFKLFLQELEKQNKPIDGVFCVLHTELMSEPGTDLVKVKEAILGEKYRKNLLFSTNRISQQQLNYLYNVADVQVLLSSNEGWGLTLTESLLSGTPIIANVTGGMQDQMRFEDDNGEWIEFSPNFPSNHFGTYKKHGEWAFPLYPSCMSIQGSIPTPYIFDDRCDFRDASKRMLETYNIGRKGLRELGLKGREWVTSDEAGFTSVHQAKRFISYVDELFEIWKPKEKYEIVNANDYKGKIINYPLIY